MYTPLYKIIMNDLHKRLESKLKEQYFDEKAINISKYLR